MTTSRQQRRAAARAGTSTGRAIAARSVVIAASLAVAGLAVWFAWDRWGRTPLVRDGAPSWSPDGKQIVFYGERDGQLADLYVMNADGSSVRQLTHTPRAEGYPAWSPDGRQIAYESDDPGGNFDIYVMNADGSNVHRLTTDPRRDVGPAWSPDGTKIAFMSDRAGQEFDIYEMNADGSGVERLTAGATNWFPQFSPDGARLAFHVWRDVNVFDLKTRTLQPLTKDPENGMYPTWSPDGRQIAFMSWRNGRTEIFAMNADGSGQRVLLSPASGSAIDPRWSPDGSRIVFVETPATEQNFSQTAPLESVICTLDVATGKVTRLSR
jgi:TolB protein